jgi:hypothetical protein
MVIECFFKNSSASFGDVGVDTALGCDCEEDTADDDEPAAGEEVSC